MATSYLDTEEIMKIHDEIIAKSGGHEGLINYGNLDFTISQMRATKGVNRKVAVLLFGIITKHPFVDGNKRTGYIAAKTFLTLNNKKLLAKKKELWKVLHEISEGKMSIDQIENWISKKVK